MLPGERKIARARTDRRGRLLEEKFSCRLVSAGPDRVLWATTVPWSFAPSEAEPSPCVSGSDSHCVLPPGVGHNLPTGHCPSLETAVLGKRATITPSEANAPSS
ncbi:unnamed protein product [Rangifer tarandus platyrhynchus]|uniref:Uncharacterized protein n=2 Tax=Rangifer tarandus platyrhynchus TaxID=3082113 RepID=A0ABN8ZI42_RANTA|nr:unnamed protein product [Rangifer tarandus platyrhynchus]